MHDGCGRAKSSRGGTLCVMVDALAEVRATGARRECWGGRGGVCMVVDAVAEVRVAGAKQGMVGEDGGLQKERKKERRRPEAWIKETLPTRRVGR